MAMHVELFRRLVLAIGLLAGLWLVCSVPPYLYAVRPVDWEADRAARLNRVRAMKDTMGALLPKGDLEQVDLAPAAKGDLQEWIESETKERVVQRGSTEWQSLFVAIADTVRGRPPSQSWGERKGKVGFEDEIFLRPDEGPLADLSGVAKGDDRFWYVEIRSGDSRQWLAFTKRSKQDIIGHAPPGLAHPWRFAGFITLLVTACVYALIPWPRVRRNSMHYSRARASVVPDMMAALFGGLFFVLPILITNQNAASDGPFSGGWGVLTAVTWLLACLFFSMWSISAWYCALSLEWSEGTLRARSLLGDESFSVSEVDSVDLARIDPRRLNKFLLWTSSLVSWRAFGSALLASGPEYSLRINRRGGRSHGFPLRTLIGGPHLVAKLAESGIPVSAEAMAKLGLQNGEPLEEFPQLGSGGGRWAATLLLIAPLAALAWTAKPKDALVIPVAPLPSQPYVAPRANVWAPSPDLLKRESEILAEIAELNERIRKLEGKGKVKAGADRERALKESDKWRKRIQQLAEEFDRIRRESGAPD